MKIFHTLVLLTLLCASATDGFSQIATNWLPGRALVKLLPDYVRPRVYALNQAALTNNGTLLALNATNGATLAEISVGINPTDMAITPAGDALYVINTRSRTISKVDLATFAVTAEKAILTPNSYSLDNPLHLALGQSSCVYFTDGAWAPSITTFDYAGGTNRAVYDDGNGAGGIATSRDGKVLYRWRQYGWGAGNVNSWVTRYDAGTNVNLTPLEDSFVSWRRDPYDTPVLLDAAETRAFNKQQMFVATNVSVLLTEFTENIYAISFDGSLAFGPTKVFNSQNGIALTNFSLSTTVQCLSGDQRRLFRYRPDTSDLFVHDMAGVAPVNGPTIVPTPPDGAVVGSAPTNLLWSVSPIALAYDVYFGTNRAAVSNATLASAQSLGRVTSTSKPVPQVLVPGSTYYWRVDVVGFNATNAGPVWSFTVSPLVIVPPEIVVGAIAGYNPAGTSLNLTSTVPKSWAAAVAGANWLSLSAPSGTSPSTLGVTFNTAGLPVGLYTNRIDITTDGVTARIPVTVDIKALNIIKMAADYQRPYIYALQAPANAGQNGQLLFINTLTTNIDKTLPIGINPVDLTIHYGEGRLYIASWTENATYVVDLNTQTLLPPLHLGTDVYKINAGKPGRVIVEGQDQWIAVSIVDTVTGAIVGSMPYPERQGDGEANPSGTVYYHCDDNISNAHIHKNQITGDVATEVASSLEHPYGSRNLILAPDGSRLFWRGYVYDANLNELEGLGQEIYATTAHGDLAFGSQSVFNVSNGQNIYTLPFSTSMLAISGDQQKVFLFNGTTKQLVVVPMSSIAAVPGPGLNPNPPNGSVVNLPLANVSWTASPFALNYHVFFGTNLAAVTVATTNSSQYLGYTANTSFALPPLNTGRTYYWRVDSAGFAATATGVVWSFTASQLVVSPQQLSIKGVVGLPILPQNLSLSSGTSLGWTLGLSQTWVAPSATNGTTPSSVTLNFNTANLAVGFYTNQLTFVANGIPLQIPVVVQLFNLNATKMVVDPNRNMIYALHPGSGGIADAFVLFLNTETGVVEKVLPIGSNATDLAVHPREDRLYVSNWQRAETRIVDLATRTELPPILAGSDVYKINAGLTGRIVVEEQDQWITASLINSTNGATVATVFLREGDGEADPTGRYYYHVGNNSSGEGITKFDTGNNSFVSVASAGKHNGYGSRNLVMSLDGSRLFWTTAMYDANLYDYGVIGPEIYACSTNGSIAFGASQAYDTATKQLIYTLPVSSSVMAVDRRDQRLWYFNGSNGRIESIPLATIRSPSITQQPAANTSVGVGGAVYLTVTAMGPPTLAYQWTLAGTNVPSATNYFLSMTGIQPWQEGDYRVSVSNPFGSITSSVAHVTVLAPPAITTQPHGTNVPAGQSFTLAVAATGSAPLTYRWTFEGVNISGATLPSLTTSNAQAVNEGIYRAIVQNSAGSATSVVALVRISPTKPVIVSEPVSQVVPAAANATFAVSAIGSQPMTYQWFFNGGAIAGATGLQYNINNAQAANAGNYYAVVANGSGSVTSSVATLGVTPRLPYFVTIPTGGTLPAGTNHTFTALARGSEPISYQWQRFGTNLPAATSPMLTLSNLAVADSGAYRVIAYSPVGFTSSPIANLVITSAPPVFIQQPASVSVLAGQSTTLNSLSTGSNPLGYQWYFQNAPLLDKTNRQLVLNPVTLSSAGQYFVLASNLFGAATSTVVQVTVNQAPLLSQGLSNVVADVGNTVPLSVSANGTGTLTYSWQLNGAAIAGNGETLTLSNVQPSQAGYYRVTVANQYGSISSTGQVSVFGGPSWVIPWGDNSGGQTNVPANLEDAVAVSGGDYHTLALRHNGSLLAWGYNGDQQINVPVSGLKFVGIASGASHNLAIQQNGEVTAWGRNDAGQTSVPASAKFALAVAAGDSHSLALLSTRTVVAWGDNTYGQVSGASGLAGIRSIAAGRIHNLALRMNGTVAAWGYNGYGQTTPPAGLNGITAVAAGYLHSVALRSNGTVVVWGDNSFGQADIPAGLSNVVAIAAGDFHTLALRSDGSVAGWGDNSYQQSSPPAGLANVAALSSGYYHGLALVPVVPMVLASMTADGLMVTWNCSGTLQWSASPTGPYFDVPSAGRCYTNVDFSTPAKFFRLRR